MNHHNKQVAMVETIHTCIKFDDVCKPGNTLLWDLVQDDNVVSGYSTQTL